MWTLLLYSALLGARSALQAVDDYESSTPLVYDDGDYVDLEDPLFTEGAAGGRNRSSGGLQLLKGLRNTRKEAGGSLKLRCEAGGAPPATSWHWYKNDAPVIMEKGRVRIKSGLEDTPQWSMLKINVLETLGDQTKPLQYHVI